MAQQQESSRSATEEDSDKLAARVSEMFEEDQLLRQLESALVDAKNALHSRQNELIQAAKQDLGIEGETTFECLVWEGQAGIC